MFQSKGMNAFRSTYTFHSSASIVMPISTSLTSSSGIRSVARGSMAHCIAQIHTSMQARPVSLPFSHILNEKSTSKGMPTTTGAFTARLLSSSSSSSSIYNKIHSEKEAEERKQRVAKIYEEIKQKEEGLNQNEGDNAKGIPHHVLSRWDRFKLAAMSQTGIIIGGLVLTFFVSEVVIKLSSGFLHLDFETVGMAGFIAGFLTCGGTIGLMYLGWRITFIRPGGVFNDTLDLIRNNKEVCDMLGVTAMNPVRAGSIRAYQIHKGGLGFKSAGKIGWTHPQLEMMFQVYGPNDQAIVICQARKVGGRRVHDFVSVESATNPESPILLLVGDESKMKVRDELQKFVTLNQTFVTKKAVEGKK